MKKFVTKKHITALGIITLLCCTVLLIPSVWAQTERTVNLQVPFPGAEGGKLTVCNTSAAGEVTCGGISGYIVKAYQWTIGFVMILCVLMFVFAGLLWMTPGGVTGSKEGEHVSNVQRAKTIIRNTLVGLMLAIGSYVFLYAINPDLTTLPSLTLGKKVEKIDLEIKFEPVDSEKAGDDVDPSDPNYQPPPSSGSTLGSSLANMPLFKQRNFRQPYGRCGTISAAGCGPTSSAMVARFYGKSVDPVSMANLFATNGFRACNSSCNCQGTSYGAFTSSATFGSLGLKGQQISRTGDLVDNYLRKGKPIIVSVGPSIFTKGGHFIVLTGVDSEGNITVNDPAKTCYAGIGCTNHVPQNLVLPHIKAAFYIHP